MLEQCCWAPNLLCEWEDFTEGSLQLSTEHHRSSNSTSWHFFTKDSFRNSKENSHHISSPHIRSALYCKSNLQNATTLKPWNWHRVLLFLSIANSSRCFSFPLSPPRGTRVRSQERLPNIFHCSEGEFCFTLHLIHMHRRYLGSLYKVFCILISQMASLKNNNNNVKS